MDNLYDVMFARGLEGGGGGGFTPTQSQLDAMNSGITEELVTQIGTNETNILSLQSEYIEDLKQYAYKTTMNYIQSSGALSQSNKWNAYWFNAADFKKINYVKSYTNNATYKQIAFYSDTPSNTTFISGVSFSSTTEATVSENITIPSNAKYFIITNRNASATDDVIKGTRKDGFKVLAQQVNSLPEVKLANSTLYYYGEKIQLKNRTNYNTFLLLDSNGQGGCVYDDKLFRFLSNNTFKVYDISTSQSLGTGQLAGSLSPHCNTACFGNKYNSGDTYPLVYTNAYNNTDLPKGTCYVYRINADFTNSLIQTISIGFTNESIWTDGEGDTRPYGNFCVDAEHGFLYVYTLLDTQNITRFFKFALPSTSSATVTLTQADILDTFDCTYFPYIQDNHYIDGKLYILGGFGTNSTHGMLHVVDLVQQKEVSYVDLNEIGLADLEPECIDVYSGDIILGNGTIYKFEF